MALTPVPFFLYPLSPKKIKLFKEFPGLPAKHLPGSPMNKYIFPRHTTSTFSSTDYLTQSQLPSKYLSLSKKYLHSSTMAKAVYQIHPPPDLNH